MIHSLDCFGETFQVCRGKKVVELWSARVYVKSSFPELFQVCLRRIFHGLESWEGWRGAKTLARCMKAAIDDVD